MQRIKTERPKRREVNPPEIKGLYISPKGEMFAPCGGCKTFMRFYKLQPVRVKVGYGRKFIDGIHIAKNGRIYYTKPHWQNFPQIVVQHRCVKCRHLPEVQR